jgi:hypothetical protein
MKKIITVITIIAFILIVIAGCASNMSEPAPTPPYNNESESPDSGIVDSEVVVNPTNRKVLYDIDIKINTSDFDQTLRDLKAAINDENANHWTKSADISAEGDNKTARYIIKVETEHLNTFLDAMPNLGTVSSETIRTEDITYDYASTEAKISALEAEKAYYLELMEQPAVASSVSLMRSYMDIVSDINEELSIYNQALTQYDSALDFSTITITVTYNAPYIAPEVVEEPEITFGERIKRVFVGSYNVLMTILKGLLVAIAAIFPFAVLGACVLIILFFGKKFYVKLKVKVEKFIAKNNLKKIE